MTSSAILPPAAAPADRGHFVRFYEREDLLIAEVVEFIESGLRAGGSGIVIATPAHRQAIERRLEGPGGQAGAGRLVMLDAARTLEAFLVEGWPDRARFRQVVGAVVAAACARGGPVHAFGEMVALLCERGRYDAALHLEALWNELAAMHRFSLFCAYARRLFADSERVLAFQQVCGAHTHVCTSEQLERAQDPAELQRLVALWEQKAAALEAEVARRMHAEAALRRRELELRDTLAEREQLVVRLEHANRAKDEFLAMLGHELRNPLSPIVTALQLMRMRGDTGTSREQAVIQRQLDHLVRLVDDLLDIAKVTRGKIELKKEWVAVADVLTKAVEMSSPLLEQRSHRLQIDVAEGLRVHGDALRLAQVVSNLLNNAARYTDPGGDIRLCAQARPGAVEIRVKDNGSGIAPELQSQVFDIFFQGGGARGRSEGGLGIGLALVKSFVALHHGTVALHSEGPGRGSEFTVRIPINSEGAAAAPPPPALLAGHAGVQGKGLRLLLVDDNRDAADTMAQLLRAAGHEVQVMHDPALALAHAASFAPDLAILDIGLPGLDGYELAQRLRREPDLAGCRFAALTGYGQDSDKARSEAAGFSAHFVKPVDPQLLLRFAAETARAWKVAPHAAKGHDGAA